MVREEVVDSAVRFLQDPSTTGAPAEKRIEFLRSKGLTQEEIEVSLARAGQRASQFPQEYAYHDRLPNTQPAYPQYEWRSPPVEPARRDWRDWFIMATVASGASFALYTLADRYIKPLIAPPTPPQIEQDKAAIDEQFSRAFALMDTLAEDTAALKRAEEARTERLDNALAEVENVLAEIKLASSRREEESKRISDEVKTLKDGLPRAIDGVREASERRLQDLNKELTSLRVLMGGRTEPAPAPPKVPETASTPTRDGNKANAGDDVPFVEPNPWSRFANAPQTSGARPFASGSKATIPSWQTSARNDVEQKS